jgi:hypothetical protein
METLKEIGEVITDQTVQIVSLIKTAFKPALWVAKGSLIFLKSIYNLVYGIILFVVGILGIPFGI